MKMKKAIIRTLIVMMVIILGLGSIIPSLAAETVNKELSLSYFRYVNGEYTNGYAIPRTVGGQTKRYPILQITSQNNEKNLYCLNATNGYTWNDAVDASTAKKVTYDASYNLDSSEDVESIKGKTAEAYKASKNIVESPYLKQILWILENMYVPGPVNNEEDQQNNEKLQKKILEKAGIVFGEVDAYDINDNQIQSYKYVAPEGYDYSNKLNDTSRTIPNPQNQGLPKGWFYINENKEYVHVRLSEDLIEVAQQLALWYYTNYKENNPTGDNNFNFKDYKVDLYRGIHGIDSNNILNWDTIDQYKYDDVELGRWLEDQVTILTSYLIDAADNYANSGKTATGNPLAMKSATAELAEKTVSGTNYYVVGPMEIDEVRAAVYSLNNTISINRSTSTGAYISDKNGNKKSNQTISNYIGQEFYIAVPKSKVTGDSIQISFTGKYNSNKKSLLVNETVGEQPVVEVEPDEPGITLNVTATINKQFDLALRKVITALKSSDGNTKPIKNEKATGNGDAKRNVNIIKSTIASNGTATYQHRKDPVVVEKGDVITYSITIYNEGEMDGYAKTIVDKLPNGLALKGYTENGTKKGTYQKGNIKYLYEYDENNNTITFTNESENKLSKFDGSTLNSETIEIECVVTQEPSNTTNTYLTNIAYITGAHNTETDKDVVEDRDSRTDNNPSAEQNVTGDKYPDTAYRGGDSKKDVYNDGTNNNDYFPGQEDDDDFEIVVVKQAEFDLALQKYITNVISPDGTIKQGRNAPTINTKSLADKTDTDATYTFNQNKQDPIKVKSGDYVLYTFTVYNEGEAEGYVNKITDNIPTGLQFVYVDGKTVRACDSQGEGTELEVSDSIYQSILEHNVFWKIDPGSGTGTSKKDTYNGEQTVSVTCDVTKYTSETYKLLNPYNRSAEEKHNYDGTTGLDRTSVTLLLRVNGQDGTGLTIRNEAAITEAADKDGNKQDNKDLKDRDSQTDQWKGKDGDKDYQDDEDYDNIILGKVDLALNKFITAICDDVIPKDGEYLTANGKEGSKENPYTRAPKVDITPLKNGDHDASYKSDKSVKTIPENSYVLYNIRVYNEGNVDVYAGEVKDYLPEYLTFVHNAPINNKYGWTANGKTLTTNYLSKQNGTDKILKAFDGSELDYQDLQVLCRINSDAPDKTRLINSAEITKYEDENGNNIEKDIDSTPSNLGETKKNKEGNPNGRYDEDDEDYEAVEVKKKKVDLALTKFITAISDDENIDNGEYLTPNHNVGSKTNPYTRATKVDTTPLRNGTAPDAKYDLDKSPQPVPENSYILYNIRVYNEGEVDVYAGEVKDYLPNYLEFAPGEFNTKYGWKVSSDGTTVTTNYLSSENGVDKILLAFDKDTENSELDYKDLPILCRIKADTPDKTKVINSAEITKYEDEYGNNIEKDIDSTPSNLDETKKNKEGKPEGRYDEDDEDYELVEVRKKRVDLALSKFIAAISDDVKIMDGEYLTENENKGSKENPYTRATAVDTKELRDNEECHDATYEKVKDPLTVPAQSYVLYDIRVYNEGETDVYAGEVTDYLPEYLDYVDCDFNKDFKWIVASDGKTISTTYLSHANGEENLLKAFDKKTDDGKGSGLDYRDLQVLCKVNDKAPSNTDIVNVAEITKYENKDGDPIPDDDIDSKPKNANEKNEDDDDYETVRVRTFDLSLLKYVSEVYVTEDGKTTTTQTGNTGDNNTDSIPKVEVNKKKLNSTVVKFGYTIKITNEGDIEGYAKEITDYVPQGLKFYAEDNNGWRDEGNNVISTRLLENTLLKPGESAEVKVIFRWINGSNNLGLKTNIAEISEDYNKEGVPDRDSTPDNRKEGEDDIDDAKVLLSIKTGLIHNFVMYTTVGLIILVVMGAGITAIKKYVL